MGVGHRPRFAGLDVPRPGHQNVELPPCSCPTQRIEGRAAVPALGAADAVILVDLDDLTAHAARDLAQLALLIGRGLFDGADTKVDNRSAHSLASPFEMPNHFQGTRSLRRGVKFPPSR